MAAKHTGPNQGLLLLLSLVLLACYAIPAEVGGHSGQSIDDHTRSKVMTRAHDVITEGDVNSRCCESSLLSNSAEVLFCCKNQDFCWPSLPECEQNCPC
ncbi:unnamed protein product [Urochloa decumbens]|uniref:Meg domain-containing protein n=1 Tax=Urochloa decumbens TaxID=240449 RepID=A0ABC9B9D9_9POAL